MNNIKQAVALCRISSEDQRKGHSLEAQETSVKKISDELGVELVRTWTGVQTSLKGKNFGRKDMEEILRYCKQNKNVKFVLVDMVNRLMREMKVMIYYLVLFEQQGVKVYFCDPGQQHLNRDDQLSQLMLIIEGYKAEQDNVTRRETTVARMKARYQAGYYISHPHAGYKKSSVAGLHIPDLPRFDILQSGCKKIIYDTYTVSQAVQWMNSAGYHTVGGKKLDINHFVEFIVDRYYCGTIDIHQEGWPKGVKGVHQPMLSVREHELLIAALSKRNPRVRYKHNPDFPIANLLRHYECRGNGGYEKFCGHNFNRGRRRNGRQRPKKPVYDCRDCRQRLARDRVHDAVASFFSSLSFVPSDEKFQRALVKIWRNQRGSVVERLNSLQSSRTDIENKKREATAEYITAKDEIIKASILDIIHEHEKSLIDIDRQVLSTKATDSQSADFVKFAMDFVRNIRDKWWEISFEDKKRGEQIIFNGQFYIDSSAKVHTPLLSPIFRLGTSKKDLDGSSFSHLVELVGTAPTSAGLSWLVFYRYSLFYDLKQ
jgi:DNA invertase Pin-like site-specific DNA recombinase